MRRLKEILSALTLCVMALQMSLLRAADEVPDALSGVKIVSAAQVRGMAGTANIVDTRILHDFLAGHLPRAIHIPYKERSVRDVGFDPNQDDVPAFLARLHKFVADKGAAVVFYCNGPSCWKSYKSAVAALKAGYRQVYWFRGGMSEWNAGNLEIVIE